MNVKKFIQLNFKKIIQSYINKVKKKSIKKFKKSKKTNTHTRHRCRNRCHLLQC